MNNISAVRTVGALPFLADPILHGRTYATMLRLTICTECIVARAKVTIDSL